MGRTAQKVNFISNSNYIIRQIGTSRTQCVHRARLRPFTMNTPLVDIVDNSDQHDADPDATDDQALFDGISPTITVSDYHHLEQFDENDQILMIIYNIMISYEYTTRTSPIQESPPIIVRPIPDNHIVPPTREQQPVQNNEPNNLIHTRNNTTRYSLRESPKPKT